VVSLLCGLLFVRNLLQTRHGLPKFDRVLRAISYSMVFTVPLILFGDYDVAIYASLIVTSVFFNVTLIAIIMMVLKRDRTAKIVLAAWSIFLTSGTVSMLGIFGFLPTEVAGTHALQIGSMLEVVLLSLALADRIKTLRKEKLDMEIMSNEILKVSNEQLEKSNKLKDAFIATISHEIKTPMNAILGSTQLLKDGSSFNNEQIQYLDVIERSGQSLVGILDNILEYSKLAAGKVKVADRETPLEKLCEDVTSLFQLSLKQKPVRLWLTFASDMPKTVVTDDVLMKHLIMNLLSNAIKFTNKGFVWLHLSLHQDRWIKIEVRDSGIGMTPEQMERIFRPFTQAEDSTSRSYGGTGLGLVICKKVCELLKGSIEVDSVEGEGTVFTALIPISEKSDGIESTELPVKIDIAANNTNREASLMLSRLKLSGQNESSFLTFNKSNELEIHQTDQVLTIGGVISQERLEQYISPQCIETSSSNRPVSQILAVDDDATNRMIISKMLNKLQVPFQVVASGQEAIEALKADEFDLILMDIEMPGKDGYETTEEIRKWEAESGRKPVNITALSAHAESEFKEKALLSGMNDFLSKPIKIANLKGLLGLEES
jgi:signal transduction histidine kinase/ActR/RegA family two-component response regulator